MGYVPLFDNLTTGTLHGRWPDIGLWPVILSMADRFGNVDVTPAYIAGVTGLPEADVIACIGRFCAPDPDSRTTEHDGRRLRPLEAGRKWGWHIVNHAKYREKARLLSKDSARTASGMDAERKRKARECPPVSPEIPPSDGDGNEDVGKEPASRSSINILPLTAVDNFSVDKSKNPERVRDAISEKTKTLKARVRSLVNEKRIQP